VGALLAVGGTRVNPSNWNWPERLRAGGSADRPVALERTPGVGVAAPGNVAGTAGNSPTQQQTSLPPENLSLSMWLSPNYLSVIGADIVDAVICASAARLCTA